MPSPPFPAGVKGRSATLVGSGRRTCSSGRSRGFSAVLVSALVTRGTLSYRIPPTLAQVETQTLSATDRLEEKPMRMAVFSSKHKYDSETGWPSFYQPIEKAHVGETEDKSISSEVRTEVHCNRCGGHLWYRWYRSSGCVENKRPEWRWKYNGRWRQDHNRPGQSEIHRRLEQPVHVQFYSTTKARSKELHNRNSSRSSLSRVGLNTTRRKYYRHNLEHSIKF